MFLQILGIRAADLGSASLVEQLVGGRQRDGLANPSRCLFEIGTLLDALFLLWRNCDPASLQDGENGFELAESDVAPNGSL